MSGKLGDNELRDLVRDLLAGQRLAVLATHTDGQPYTSLVAFAWTDDLRVLVFPTPRSSRKYANLIADPRVALLIDNRDNAETDFEHAAAATALGRAAEVAAADPSDLRALFLARHPRLSDFLKQPDTALLAVTVTTYRIVHHFQQTAELAL